MPCVLPSLEESPLSESDEKKLDEIIELMKENGIEGPLMISFALKTSPRGLFCALVVVLVTACSFLEFKQRSKKHLSPKKFDWIWHLDWLH